MNNTVYAQRKDQNEISFSGNPSRDLPCSWFVPPAQAAPQDGRYQLGDAQVTQTCIEGQSLASAGHQTEALEEEILNQISVAFEALENMTEEEIREAATAPTISPQALPGPALIISCVLNAAWVLKDGINRNNVIIKITDIVVGCLAIPFLSGPVSKLVWKHRHAIARALKSIVPVVSALLENDPPCPTC